MPRHRGACAQITVGAPSRAEGLAAHFDAAPPAFRLVSERGFTTLTGRFRGVPVSVVSIGMGHPNADFFVREVRECVRGDMVVVRSAGAFPPPRFHRARGRALTTTTVRAGSGRAGVCSTCPSARSSCPARAWP